MKRLIEMLYTFTGDALSGTYIWIVLFSVASANELQLRVKS